MLDGLLDAGFTECVKTILQYHAIVDPDVCHADRALERNRVLDEAHVVESMQLSLCRAFS